MCTIEPETATSLSLREKFQPIVDHKMGKGAVVFSPTSDPDSFYIYAVPPGLQHADRYERTHAIDLRIIRHEDDLFVSLEGKKITPAQAKEFVDEFYRSLAPYIRGDGETTAHLAEILNDKSRTNEALTEIANALHKVVSPLLDSPEPQF